MTFAPRIQPHVSYSPSGAAKSPLFVRHWLINDASGDVLAKGISIHLCVVVMIASSVGHVTDCALADTYT